RGPQPRTDRRGAFRPAGEVPLVRGAVRPRRAQPQGRGGPSRVDRGDTLRAAGPCPCPAGGPFQSPGRDARGRWGGGGVVGAGGPGRGGRGTGRVRDPRGEAGGRRHVRPGRVTPLPLPPPPPVRRRPAGARPRRRPPPPDRLAPPPGHCPPPAPPGRADVRTAPRRVEGRPGLVREVHLQARSRSDRRRVR